MISNYSTPGGAVAIDSTGPYYSAVDDHGNDIDELYEPVDKTNSVGRKGGRPPALPGT